MNALNIILIYAICFVPIIVIFAMMPYIGRRNLTFGVSIPSESYDDKELKELRKAFSRNVIIAGALLSVICLACLFYLEANLATGILTGLVLVYIFIIFFFYIKNFNKVKQIKSDRGWKQRVHETTVADTSFSTTRRAVSSLWFLIYAVIILGTLILGLYLYDAMPDQIIMQTDMQGNATRVVDKSFGVILFGPAMQAIITILFGFIYWMMQKTPPVLDPDNPQISSKQNTVFRYRWSAFIVFGGMVLILIFMFMQFGFANILSPQAALWIPMSATGALVIGAIILSIKTGQSGSRIRLGKTTGGNIIRRDDDKYWKWCSVYVNKDDPALFVEKRFGVGFTLNFGRKSAILIGVGFLVFIVAVIVFSTILVK